MKLAPQLKSPLYADPDGPIGKNTPFAQTSTKCHATKSRHELIEVMGVIINICATHIPFRVVNICPTCKLKKARCAAGK